MHHKLPGQSFCNEASPIVVNAVLTLWHDKNIPQHHVGAALLIATFGCAALSLLQ
jgi:hypothetical protein